MFQVNNKDTRTTPYFTSCSSVSIVNSKQVNAGWGKGYATKATMAFIDRTDRQCEKQKRTL